MMKWNGMRGLEWKWIRVIVKEVVEKKNERELQEMNGQRTWMRMGLKSRYEW